MMRVTLFTKEDCQLCRAARQSLNELKEELPHQLVEIDIESDHGLRERYQNAIPVVQVGPYTLEAPFSETDLRVVLAAARDGAYKIPERKGRDRKRAIQINKGVLFFTNHWLAIFNLMVFIYLGLPFSAPTLMHFGWRQPAKWIYTIYSPLCHQFAFRSWFLFGRQPAYPLERAGTSLVPYSQATGISADDYGASRRFMGNQEVGYKVAFCERDAAIYGGIFLAGLLFSLVRKRLKPLSLFVWALVGIMPIAIDGGSQLLAGSALPVFSAFPARESTPLLRTLTGALFGIMNVWMAYPYIEESMQDTRVLLVARSTAAEKSGEDESAGEHAVHAD